MDRSRTRNQPVELGAIEQILRGVENEEPALAPPPAPPGAGSLRGHAFLAARPGGAIAGVPQPGTAPTRPTGRDNQWAHRSGHGLRPGPAPSPPRTAFLRSRIAPAERTPSQPAGAPAQAPAPAPAAPPARDPLDLLDSNEPLLTAEELDAFFSPPEVEEAAPPSLLDPALLDPAGTARRDVADVAAEARPVWLKRQVADLADLVQALDMRARSNHAHLAFEGELARLRQFTRTIGFVASPPPRGSQTFDLADFVEEQLGQIAGQSPDSPRLLFRRRGYGGTADVTADRALVALSLDALLQTAVACSSSGDVVRVSVEGSSPAVSVRVDFPVGPLGGLHPGEIQRPYALRSVLPEIGPNAIAAAGAIAVGQGGDLSLEELSGGRLAFTLSLT